MLALHSSAPDVPDGAAPAADAVPYHDVHLSYAGRADFVPADAAAAALALSAALAAAGGGRGHSALLVTLLHQLLPLARGAQQTLDSPPSSCLAALPGGDVALHNGLFSSVRVLRPSGASLWDSARQWRRQSARWVAAAAPGVVAVGDDRKNCVCLVDAATGAPMARSPAVRELSKLFPTLQCGLSGAVLAYDGGVVAVHLDEARLVVARRRIGERCVVTSIDVAAGGAVALLSPTVAAVRLLWSGRDVVLIDVDRGEVAGTLPGSASATSIARYRDGVVALTTATELQLRRVPCGTPLAHVALTGVTDNQWPCACTTLPTGDVAVAWGDRPRLTIVGVRL
jgi:hypothetical protein